MATSEIVCARCGKKEVSDIDGYLEKMGLPARPRRWLQASWAHEDTDSAGAYVTEESFSFCGACRPIALAALRKVARYTQQVEIVEPKPEEGRP